MLGKVKINWKREILTFIAIIIISGIVAVGLWIFVEGKQFAPSGVDGIAIMIQDGFKMAGINIDLGVFTFALNAPLLIAAWFLLNKRYVIYTTIYILTLSGTLLLLPVIGCPQYPINDTNPLIMAAIFGGVVQGFSSFLLKMGGSAGGADVIGCMIQKKVPHKDVEKIIAYVSYAVVAVSFFVYNFNINSVCLSAIVIFVCEKVTSLVLKSNRSAIKVEIITDKEHVNELRNFIIFDLHHGATMLKAQGGFSDAEKDMIVCLVNFRQLPVILKKVKATPNTFMYYADITGVGGNFDFKREDENPEDIIRLEQRRKEIEEQNNEEQNLT